MSLMRVAGRHCGDGKAMRTAFRDGDKKEPCSVPVLCIVQRHVQVFHLQTVSRLPACTW